MPRVEILLLLSFLVPAGRAEESDPPGTELLVIDVGNTAPMTEAAGATVLCDDPTVAAPEYSADGNAIVLRGLKPGSTLCGVWLVRQTPGGLHRVRVVPAPSDAGPPPL